VKSYSIAYQHAARHGIVAAVHLPHEPGPIPEDAWDRLHPREAEYARALSGLRQISYVGGRLALRLATQQLGVVPSAMLSQDSGAPQLPSGLVGSLSHKREIAIAMVSLDHGATIGVDLEDYGPPRSHIAPRVLTPAELAAIENLSEPRRWMSVLLRFSLKESIYKAIHPWVQRYVSFHEAEVTPDPDGGAEITLKLEGNEGPFVVEGAYQWLHGRLMTSVRIQPAPVQYTRRTPNAG
jgi:enterobactin synthetase component D